MIILACLILFYSVIILVSFDLRVTSKHRTSLIVPVARSRCTFSNLLRVLPI